MEKLVIKNQNESLDAYINYQKHGGESQFGPFTSKTNKLLLKSLTTSKKYYIHWTNKKNKDCKLLLTSTKCFCNHRLKQHSYLSPDKNRKIKCLAQNCKCRHFYYIPVHGSQDFKCSCKHSYEVHKNISKKCRKCDCARFKSNWSCSCGMKFGEHELVCESREERGQRGKVVRELEGEGPGRLLGVGGFGDLVEYGDGFGRKVDEFNERDKRVVGDVKAVDLYDMPHKY